MEKPPIATDVVLSAAEAEPPLVPPHGRDEIIGVFGDIREYIGTDGQLEARWQLEFLAKATLPFPLRLSWDPVRTVTRMTCHRRRTGIFASVFASISRRRAAGERHELWRMLCLSSAANRQQTV